VRPRGGGAASLDRGPLSAATEACRSRGLLIRPPDLSLGQVSQVKPRSSLAAAGELQRRAAWTPGHRRYLSPRTNILWNQEKHPMKRSRNLALASLLAAAASYAAPARACSVCGCGDPLLAASDPAAINGQLRLQLDTEYLRVDAGTDGQPGSTDRLKQWSYRFNVVYRPIDGLAFTATLPLVSKSIRTVGGGADVLSSDLTGLGDVEVAGRYRLWRSVDLGHARAQELAISGGSSLPTGDHNARTGAGDLIDPHGQLGTGAWSPFVGLNYLFEQGSWLAFASVSGRLRTEGSYFDGSKYKFGDALLWSTHGQYRPVRRVALDLGVDGRYAKSDRMTDGDGVVMPSVENTGGTVLSAAPGVYFNATGGLWLFVRGQIPFYKSLFGAQDVLPSFTTGIQFQPM
jgi:hypothetical protein